MKSSLITTFLSLLFSASIQAATVATLADAGPGSLRSAIANAAPGETIGFSVTGVITLTSGELLVNKALNISGPGANKLRVMRSTAGGTLDFRIFHMTLGEISLSGVTVANGKTNSGGGILNETSLRIQNCSITGNSATS